MGGREPSERESTAYYDASDSAPRARPRFLSAPLALVRPRYAPTRRCSVRRHADALPRPAGKRVSGGGTRARARPPQHERQQSHRGAKLNRLVLRPVRLGSAEPERSRAPGVIARATRAALRFALGGFGLRILAPFWASYRREREHRRNTRTSSSSTRASTNTRCRFDRAHPSPTELRIDRLRKAGLHALALVAPGQNPSRPPLPARLRRGLTARP